MKSSLLTVLLVSLAVVTWQRMQLVDLREMEQSLAQRSAPAKAVPSTKALETVAPSRPGPIPPGLSEKEFAQFTTDLQARRGDFAAGRFHRFATPSSSGWIAFPHLCEPLARLNSRQLRSVLEAWSEGKPIGGRTDTALGRFVLMARRVNPAALTQLCFELKQEGKESQLKGEAGGAIEYWFKQDPEGLLQWARPAGSIVTGDSQCALWVDAAAVLDSPSVENIERLLSHKMWNAKPASGEVLAKLPSEEARLRFLQTLHAVTGGNIKEEMGNYIGRLAAGVSFPQLAKLADAAPPFVMPPADKTPNPDKPSGSLRYEIALRSRDSTPAERWQWLIQRPADRPVGVHLTYLVKEWCDDNYTETTRWVKSLPAGPERDGARSAVIGFLKYNNAFDLAVEWEAEK